MSQQSMLTAQLEVFALQRLRVELETLLVADDSHTDLRWPNILVNQSLDIISVIDWEWAALVPVQLLTQPTWISGQKPEHLAGDEYRAAYTQLLSLLASRTHLSDGHAKLMANWTSDLPNRWLPIAEIFCHHSNTIAIFYHTLYLLYFEERGAKLVPKLMELSENKALRNEARRKHEASEEYADYLKANGLFVPDPELERCREMERLLRELQSTMPKCTF